MTFGLHRGSVTVDKSALDFSLHTSEHKHLNVFYSGRYPASNLSKSKSVFNIMLTWNVADITSWLHNTHSTDRLNEPEESPERLAKSNG